MQRKRLQKIVDPIKYMLAVDASNYSHHQLNHFHSHTINLKQQVFRAPQTLGLLASCVPLMFATQSLIIPFIWFNAVMLGRNHRAVRDS